MPTVENEPLLSGLRRNASAQLGARVIGVVAQGLALLLVARELGPAEYGAFALVSTLTLMATVVADWGLLMAGARAAAVRPDDRDLIVRACLAVRLGLGVGAALVLVALSFAGSDRGDVHLAAAIAGLSFLLAAWFAVGHIRAQLDLRMERVALAALAGSLASVAYTLGVLAADGGIVALSATFVVAALVSAIAIVLLTPGGLPLIPSRGGDTARVLLRESHPIGIGALLVTVYFYVDAILLARLSSTTELAYYDAAYRFLQIGILVPGAVIGSVYTLAARLAAEDRERMAEFVRELLSVVVLVAPIPVVLLATAPDPLMELLYGGEFRPAGGPLAILAFGLMLVLFSGIVGPLLVTLGRERATMKVALVATVLNIAINLVLIPEYGARGAAWATLVTELAVIVPAMMLLRHELPALRLDVGHLARVLAATAAAAAVILALPGHVLLRLLAGFAVYAGVAVATGAASRRHLDLTRSA